MSVNLLQNTGPARFSKHPPGTGGQNEKSKVKGRRRRQSKRGQI